MYGRIKTLPGIKYNLFGSPNGLRVYIELAEIIFSISNYSYKEIVFICFVYAVHFNNVHIQICS